MQHALSDLNLEQRAAVLHGDGPILVLAGAGSGKTRVITHRIARLIDDGASPRELLAVTFTNKAAGEMRERLIQLVGDRAWEMWIGTFHSTCARLLRQHAEHAGLSRDFTIFDDDDQKRVVTQLLKELNVSDRITPRGVLARIDRAKNAGEDLTRLPARDYVDDVARRVYPLYTARLARENAVDFNDLLLKVLRLLELPGLGESLSRRFSHVLVDEFQDTNRVQYRLVRHLARGTSNLCVVGDDDQSIYSWRGAEPRNLLEFDRDFPSARVIKLERNYRSSGHVLAAANAVIAKNPCRHDKALWTDRDAGEPILLEECHDERAEAEFVASAIQGLRAVENRTHGDMAILYRTHAQSRVLEESLRAARIPYRIIGGVSFFQRREVKDITEYLRLIVNPHADTAFERIVNVPTRGIGDTTLDRIRGHAVTGGLSLLEAARSCAAGAASALGPQARRKVESFVELMDSLRATVSSRARVSEILAQVIERTGYAERLEIEDKIDGPERLRNLHELVAAAAACDDEAGPEATPAGFLERVALVASADDKDGRQGDAVTLMTIHAAKGLEFSVVFLAGLEEGVFPALRGDGDLDHELQEERRLAYVAITRARDRLVFSHARTRRTYDEIRRNEPSRFIFDVPKECLAVRARPAARRPDLADRRHERRSMDDVDQTPAFEEPIYILDDEGEDPVFPPGARVRHKIFGIGQVQEGSGRGPDRKLTIQFPGHGKKTIVARFVEKV
ncbi:MAG: UvrD-helicase domain-containing protein [Deltaproteobacteria bacterium]|nr:UvrD-helicase domain-containing protein [Deltaproteobacteria bacterium]